KPGSRHHLAIPHRQYEDQGPGKKTSDSASDKTAKPQRNCAGGDNPRLCSGTEGKIGDAQPSLGEGRKCYGEEDGSQGYNAEIDCRGDREDTAKRGPGCRAEERPTIDPTYPCFLFGYIMIFPERPDFINANALENSSRS